MTLMQRNPLVLCEHFELLKSKSISFEQYKVGRVTAMSPASIANLGAGFDVLGMAIKGFLDKVEVEIEEGKGFLDFRVIEGEVPSGEKNVVYRIADGILRACGVRNELDVKIRLWKGVPTSMGLGSSAASSVAITAAIDQALGLNLNPKEAVLISACGEKFVAGSLHYDNVSASYLGGIVLTDHTNLSFIKLPIPKHVFFTIVMPVGLGAKEDKTMAARKALPKYLELEKAVKQGSALGKLVASLFLNDRAMFSESVSTDYMAEPYRKNAIPMYDILKGEAFSMGALGFNISGAGPSVFAVSIEKEKAEEIGKSLSDILEQNSVPAKYLVVEPSELGVTTEKKA